MKKVLHYVSAMNRGGQETFIMNVFRAIDKEKVSFDFLCTLSVKGAYDDEISVLGGNIYSLELGHYNRIHGTSWKPFFRFSGCPASSYACVCAVKEYGQLPAHL